MRNPTVRLQDLQHATYLHRHWHVHIHIWIYVYVLLLSSSSYRFRIPFRSQNILIVVCHAATNNAKASLPTHPKVHFVPHCQANSNNNNQCLPCHSDNCGMQCLTERQVREKKCLTTLLDLAASLNEQTGLAARSRNLEIAKWLRIIHARDYSNKSRSVGRSVGRAEGRLGAWLNQVGSTFIFVKASLSAFSWRPSFYNFYIFF